MIITKVGTVTLSEGPIKIDGWQVERQPEDPADATLEQLLLAYAINWVYEKFKAADKSAQMQAFREMVKTSVAKQLPAPEPNKAN